MVDIFAAVRANVWLGRIALATRRAVSTLVSPVEWRRLGPTATVGAAGHRSRVRARERRSGVRVRLVYTGRSKNTIYQPSEGEMYSPGHRMKLVSPTDFEILAVLSDGKRNNAVNVAHELDRNRAYINTRLPVLKDYGLVESVGPAPTSGLYEITEKGRVAAENRSVYEDEERDFEAFLDESHAPENGDT